MSAELSTEAGLRRELLSMSQVLFGLQQETNANSTDSSVRMQTLRSLLARGTRLLRALLVLTRALQDDKDEMPADQLHGRRLALHAIAEEYRAWIERFIFVYRQVSAQEEQSIVAADPNGGAGALAGTEDRTLLTPITQRLLASNRDALNSVETSLQNASAAVLRAMSALRGHPGKKAGKKGHHQQRECDHQHPHQHRHLTVQDDIEAGSYDDDDPAQVDASIGLWICLLFVVLFALGEYLWRQ